MNRYWKVACPTCGAAIGAPCVALPETHGTGRVNPGRGGWYPVMEHTARKRAVNTDPAWTDVPDPPMHWDRLGVPISLAEWADLMEDNEYRRIAQTMVSARYLVSTVWLGLTSIWNPPLIFETMVFDTAAEEPYSGVEEERHATEAEARDGHERIVQLVMVLEGTEDRIDR